MTMDKKLNRQELYDLVWQKPMVEISKEYGLSDRGIAKLCERHSIPVPPRGYWAKIQAGKKVIKPPLITLETSKPETAILFSQAAFKAKEAANNKELKESYPDEIQKAIDRELLQKNVVSLPKTLASPHPIIGKWMADKQRNNESYARYGGLIKPDKVGDLEKRGWRILSSLLKALEERGFKVEVDRYYQHSVHVSSESEGIYIIVDERIRQYRRELTPEEKKDSWNKDQRWTQIREPTGLLRVKLLYSEKNHTLQEFSDSEDTSLEQQLNRVIIGVIEELWKKKKLRLERQAEEHERYKRSQEKARLEELAKKELARYQELENKALQWQKAASNRKADYGELSKTVTNSNFCT